MTTLAQNIDTASEAVRAANHATMRAPLDAPTTYTVIGGLAELVSRLPQLVEYLARSTRRADPAEHYDDRGADPSHALCLAHGELTDALAALDDLAGHLDRAHNHLGHLGHLGRHITED